MSINLGLEGLRKAVIRTNFFIDELPAKTRDLGTAMVQQRIALKTAMLSDEVNQRHRKEGLKLSQERLQQIDRQRGDERRREAGERRQTLSRNLIKVGQRYEGGQAVVEKVSSVSSRALGVVSSGVKRLKPGYEQATSNASSPISQTSSNSENIIKNNNLSEINPPGNTSDLRSAGPKSTVPDFAMAPQPDNLAGDFSRLNAAIDSISLTVFTQLDGTLRSLAQTATALMTGVDRWIQDNPVLAGGMTQLVAVGGLLIAALGGIGSVVVPVLSGLNLLMAGAGVLSSVFTFAGGAIAAALGAITLPVGIVIGAIVGAAALIYTYWQPLSAFFGGVVQGISAALTPLFEAFKPLKVIFDAVGAQFDAVLGKIKEIFSPIEATAQQLELMGNLGRFVGEALVNGLRLPLTILRMLVGTVGWLLDKLGLVDKKSADAKASLDDDPPAEPPSLAADGTGNSVPDAPSPSPSHVAFGGASYRPVTTAGVSNTQQNTFNSSYVINTHPGMTQADVLAIVEDNRRQEQFAAGIKQRSSLWSQ